MGHSLSLLTAALLVGQTPIVEQGGKNCACNKAVQGRIQPSVVTDTRSSVKTWRGSTPTTTEAWSTTSEPSWIDNRPVLSRISNRVGGWFGRGDNTQGYMQVAPSVPGQQVIMQQPVRTDHYRKLPSTSEPPLSVTQKPSVQQPRKLAPATVPGVPTSRPAPAADRPTPPAPRPAPAAVRPAPQAPRAVPVEAPEAVEPLTIEIEPLTFKADDAAKVTSPKASLAAPVEAAGTPVVTTNAPPTRPNPISERFIGKVGQPGDYTWITGQLEIRGSKFLLHYATPDTIDRFGGTVVLMADSMGDFRNGDLVSARGTVVPQSGNSATYRAQTVDLIER